jgi:hypothetical protein
LFSDPYLEVDFKMAGYQQYRCLHCKEYIKQFTQLLDHLVQSHPKEEICYLKHTGDNRFVKKRIPGCVPHNITEEGKQLIVGNEEENSLLVIQNSPSTPEKILKKRCVDNAVTLKLDFGPDPTVNIQKQSKDTFGIDKFKDMKDAQCQTDGIVIIPVDDSSPYIVEMLQEMSKLLPAVLNNLHEAGILSTYHKFMSLVNSKKFPLDNIAFLLFLDVVNWFSTDKTSEMRYEFQATSQFWMIGYALFHSRFLRFMTGEKNHGQVISGTSSTGSLLSADSKVNFIVPNQKKIRQLVEEVDLGDMAPGVMNKIIQDLSNHYSTNQPLKISVDAKRIKRGKGKTMGDVDLFGYEGPETLTERKRRFSEELAAVEKLIKDVKKVEKMGHTYAKDVNDDSVPGNIKLLIGTIGKRLKELREKKLSLMRGVEKFQLMVNQNQSKTWQQNSLDGVISSLKTQIYNVTSAIKSGLQLVNECGYYVACVNGTAQMYACDSGVDLASQENYKQLCDIADVPCGKERFLKQRTEQWFKLRKTVPVTGSTCHKALALDTLKEQVKHINKLVEYRCCHCKLYFQAFYQVLEHLIQNHPKDEICYLRYSGGNKYVTKLIPGCIPSHITDEGKQLSVGDEAKENIKVSESSPGENAKDAIDVIPIESSEDIQRKVQEITTLIPVILEELRVAGMTSTSTYVQFSALLDNKQIPSAVIAFLLFCNISSLMSAEILDDFPIIKQFLAVGYAIFNQETLPITSGSASIRVKNADCDKEEIDPKMLTNMKYGQDNEIHAISTIVSKIMPIWYPNKKYFEEGCHVVHHKDQPFLLVSPDGSIRNTFQGGAALGIEVKCKPKPQYLQSTPVYYSIPTYYVVQLLCEMKVMNTDRLLFVCWSEESTVSFEVQFCDVLWQKVWDALLITYGEEDIIKPSRKPSYVPDLKEYLKKYVSEKVSFLGEFPSARAVHIRNAWQQQKQQQLAVTSLVE